MALRISDIVRGEIGTAEIALRDAFRAAMRSRPALIFIDEFQVGRSMCVFVLEIKWLWASFFLFNHFNSPHPPNQLTNRPTNQALFTARDSGGGTGGRLASQLLQSMDELRATTEDQQGCVM